MGRTSNQCTDGDRRPSLSSVIVLVVCTLSSTAHADVAKDAESLAAGGDFISAAARFRDAYAHDPSRPELICNAGVAYYKASDLPRAHRYLTRCLEVGAALDFKFLANVQEVIAAVESMLSSGAYTPIEITTQPPNATVAVAGGAPFDEPLGQGRAWFPRGRYTLVASAPDFDTMRRMVKAEGSAPISVDLRLASTPTRPDRRWIGYTVGGVGAAAIGVGAVFGFRARSLADEVHDACVDSCDWSLVDDKDASGRRAQTIQFVMYGAGAVAVAAGVVLYLRGRPTKLVVAPRESGGIVSWSGRW